MRPPQTLFAFQLFAAVSLYGCGCFVPVTEKQCDSLTPCGSGWVCKSGVCHPPDGGSSVGGGGVAGGAGGGGGGGVGGGAAGGAGGGGVCGGCRDTMGKCQPGDSPILCGANGLSCTICLANQQCSGGQCITAPCSPATCPSGCCNNGTCVATSMQTVVLCGIGGQSCASCPNGQGCFFGKCNTVPPTCNPGNCSGCCSGSICLAPANQSMLNCGSGGAVCAPCAAGGLCSNGVCSNPFCSPANCPSGCCDSGKCVSFAMQSAATCGSMGTQCKPCVPGSSCSFGTCSPPACSSATCGGCCNGAACNSGTSNFACGKNGLTCAACGPGLLCQAGVCAVPPKKIGDSCSSSLDCAAIGPTAYCKLTTSSGNGAYTNGFCTRPCSADAGTNCTVDSVCLSSLQPYGEFDSFCSPRCNAMNQCRMPGYACYFINTVSTTACWLNPIPTVGFDGGTSPDAGTASFIGAACVNAGQCTNPSNAFCIQDVIPGLGASGFVGGYCSSFCSGVACVAGSSCQSVTGFSSGITQQVCLRDCTFPRTGQSNCRNGYVCEGTTGAAVGACLPRCNNSGATCPAGTACNTMSGYCN